MTILEKITTELKAFEEKKKVFVKELRKEFPVMFKPLFDKCEKITSIGWTQYTPYFNDGDTCEFSVNNSDLYVNGEYEDKVDFLDWRMKQKEKYKEELALKQELDYNAFEVLQEFKDVLETIPDEFYKDLFGDHAQVTIHSDGTIETEEYEHE